MKIKYRKLYKCCCITVTCPSLKNCLSSPWICFVFCTNEKQNREFQWYEHDIFSTVKMKWGKMFHANTVFYPQGESNPWCEQWTHLLTLRIAKLHLIHIIHLFVHLFVCSFVCKWFNVALNNIPVAQCVSLMLEKARSDASPRRLTLW